MLNVEANTNKSAFSLGRNDRKAIKRGGVLILLQDTTNYT